MIFNDLNSRKWSVYLTANQVFYIATCDQWWSIPFPEVRLRSDEYAQLRLKVTSPVEVARQVVIQQSLNERFFVAFQDQVAINGVYQSSSITEVCVLCH